MNRRELREKIYAELAAAAAKLAHEANLAGGQGHSFGETPEGAAAFLAETLRKRVEVDQGEPLPPELEDLVEGLERVAGKK